MRKTDEMSRKVTEGVPFYVHILKKNRNVFTDVYKFCI